MAKQTIGKILIAIITLVAIVGIFFIDPISQDLAYHQFVDRRTLFAAPHFWNVISNAPFFIAGVYALLRFNELNILAELKIAYWLFFFGVSMVAFGSGYYHYMPSNDTLVWDRLPMTVAFMSLFAIIISEFIDVKRGSQMLIVFIVLGVASVFYWQWTESSGAGDLRFYALVQFLPIVLIPIIIVCFPTNFDRIKGYWLLLLWYVIAKLLEYFDESIFEISGELISGHSLKHVAAAVGVVFLYSNYRKRKRISLSI